MQVPLLDLRRQNSPLEEEFVSAFRTVFKSQRFVMGPEIADFEKEIAEYCGAKHALGVSSGTDALIIALMTLGIGPGDEVITSPYTFFATVGSIHRVGAKPVFVDILPDTFNLNPEEIEKKISPDTRAIMPVHLFGQCCEMDPIYDIARKHKLHIIEDSAQSVGAEYKGIKAGNLGDIGCFSFFPSKNLGAMGDAGLVTTNNTELYERLKIMRVHGGKPKYYHSLVGGNFRMDTIQAAFLSVKLKHLDGFTAKREKNAEYYSTSFRNIISETPLLADKIYLPSKSSNSTRHIYNQYVIKVPNRDKFKSYLSENGIGCEIYYPVPLHLQECFAYLKHQKDDFPVSEECAGTSLAIPIYEGLNKPEMDYIISKITAFFREAR